MEYQVADYVSGIRSQNRRMLSRAITLVESTLQKDRILAREIVDQLFNLTRPTLRIGITGVPGVGKSTFIESFGLFLVSLGKKICVLAVDPSSNQGGGSILGDKTRMQNLSVHPACYIRPTPSRGHVGGVAATSREVMILCEAFGFDTILVETVGVGQSEVEVASMVDVFLLLMLPNSGDELQGIKKGVMELCDLLFVNKSDLDEASANLTVSQLRSAVHLFRPRYPGWNPEVISGSAIKALGLEQLWQEIEKFSQLLKNNGIFFKRRQEQAQEWFSRLLTARILEKIESKEGFLHQKFQLSQEIGRGRMSVGRAVDELMNHCF